MSLYNLLFGVNHDAGELLKDRERERERVDVSIKYEEKKSSFFGRILRRNK